VKHALRRERLRGVVWLLDIRHALSTDDQAMQTLSRRRTARARALTKGDKLSSGKRSARERERAKSWAAGGSGDGDERENGRGNCRLEGSHCRTDFRGGAVIIALLVCLIAQDPVPAGYGTLRRDDIAVRLATGTIEVQVLPLDEQVIRLLAPTPIAPSRSSCRAGPQISQMLPPADRRRIRRW